MIFINRKRILEKIQILQRLHLWETFLVWPQKSAACLYLNPCVKPSCLRTPLPCLTHQHPNAETAQVSPKSVLWAQHSPDLLPQWSRTHHLNWTMEAASSLVFLLLCPPQSVPHTQSEGACEHLSQTRTLLAQSPPLASTSHQNRTGHSSAPVPHSAPSHLRVFAHAVPSSWSTPSPSSVNFRSLFSSTSSRKSSWISLMRQAPQYRISQLCDLLLHGPHLTNPLHLFL